MWLADDATGAGTLTNLRTWWDIVQKEGLKYGYQVKPEKSWLILKDSSNLERAQNLFGDSEIKITTTGQRHLGAVIGTEEFKKTYLEEKVEDWCKRLKNLSQIAKRNYPKIYQNLPQGPLGEV